MPRNFERRFEVMVPIKNKTVHRQVLDQIMVAYLNDKKQCWIMTEEGKYLRQKGKNSKWWKFDRESNLFQLFSILFLKYFKFKSKNKTRNSIF